MLPRPGRATFKKIGLPKRGDVPARTYALRRFRILATELFRLLLVGVLWMLLRVLLFSPCFSPPFHEVLRDTPGKTHTSIFKLQKWRKPCLKIFYHSKKIFKWYNLNRKNMLPRQERATFKKWATEAECHPPRTYALAVDLSIFE